MQRTFVRNLSRPAAPTPTILLTVVIARSVGAASTPAYTVDDADGAWYVTDGPNRVAGPFDSSSRAWSWIDRHTVARRYGVAAA
jgi:hypothetical protein